VKEFASNPAWGSGGYLADKGMIALSEEQRAKHASNATHLITVKRTDFAY